MIRQRTLIISAGLFLTAGAFAAGRLSVSNEEGTTASVKAETVSGSEMTAEIPPVTVPPNLRDITIRRFENSHRILKTASPELLRQFADDLKRIPVRPKRWAAQTEFFKILINANPKAARDLILQLDKKDRRLAMDAIRQASPPQGMKEVVEVMLSFDPGEISGCGYNLLRDTLGEWAQNDPLAVKQFIEDHPEEMSYYAGLMVRNWAAYDPEGAFAWIAQQVQSRRQEKESGIARTPDDFDWVSFSEGLITSWVEGFLENDREAAISYLLAHQDNEDVARAISSVSEALFRESPDEARDFVRRLAAGSQEAALELIGAQVERGSWGDADDEVNSPEFLCNWMLQFPPDAWKKTIRPAINAWREKDATGLFAWMADLQSDRRQFAIDAVSFYIQEDQAVTELTAVMKVPDAALREQVLEHLMREWNYYRPAMVTALEKAALTPEQRARLTSMIPPDRMANLSDDADDE